MCCRYQSQPQGIGSEPKHSQSSMVWASLCKQGTSLWLRPASNELVLVLASCCYQLYAVLIL